MDDVLCVLDRSETAPIVLRAAELLAWTLSNGRVRVLHPWLLRDPSFMPSEEVMTEERERAFRADQDGNADQIVQAFETWKAHMTVTPSLLEIEGDVPAMIAEAARTASIVVVGPDAGGYWANPSLEPQGVLKAARRPIVVVPNILPLTLGERIGLACEGDIDLARLPGQVTALLRNAEQIRLLVKTDAADARSRYEFTIDALKAQGARVDLHVMNSSEARLGHALVDEALRHDCDMLIMEAHSHSWLRTALFGRDSGSLGSSMLPLLLHAG